ncbi:MAG: 50S ribosomal protein L21, partial [Desulfuromonadaceae bacterium]|nr:50S ribosomal protein L21 [Desulfuromonadaceae bacterium]
ILVFKSKRRKGYRKKYGHRQPITRLKVAAIEA